MLNTYEYTELRKFFGTKIWEVESVDKLKDQDLYEYDSLSEFITIHRKCSLLCACLYTEYVNSDLYIRQLLFGVGSDDGIEIDLTDELKGLGIQRIVFVTVNVKNRQSKNGNTLSNLANFNIYFNSDILTNTYDNFLSSLEAVLSHYGCINKDMDSVYDRMLVECTDVDTSIYLHMLIKDDGKKYNKISYALFNCFCDIEDIEYYTDCNNFVFFDAVDGVVHLTYEEFKKYREYLIKFTCFKDTLIILRFDTCMKFMSYIKEGMFGSEYIKLIVIGDLDDSNHWSADLFERNIDLSHVDRNKDSNEIEVYTYYMTEGLKDVLREKLNIAVYCG